MPVISLSSGVFDAIDKMVQFPSASLDYLQELTIVARAFSDSAPVVLQLSSTLIRIRQDLVDPVTDAAFTVEARFSGTGIGPVSTLAALQEAIDNGLATGALSRFQLLMSGDTILDISMGTSGYVVQSGNQTIELSGTLPLTFTQFGEMAGLLTQLVDLYSLTRAERLALFDDLDAYGISRFAISDHGDTLFAIGATATTASLTLNGLTFTLKGSFPDTLGEDISLIYDVLSNFSIARNIGAMARFGLGDLAVKSMTITDSAGHVLAKMTGAMDGQPTTWSIDGRAVDEVQMGGLSVDWIEGQRGAVNSVIAGLAEDDILFGFANNDRLFGGLGNDSLYGGTGGDRLDGGGGRDTLEGGTGADVFVFSKGDGADRITDFAVGIDRISLLAASGLRDLTFTRSGADVLVEFGTIDILVEDTTILQLKQAENFLF